MTNGAMLHTSILGGSRGNAEEGGDHVHTLLLTSLLGEVTLRTASREAAVSFDDPSSCLVVSTVTSDDGSSTASLPLPYYDSVPTVCSLLSRSLHFTADCTGIDPIGRELSASFQLVVLADG